MGLVKIDRKKTKAQALASTADQDTIFFPTDDLSAIVMGGNTYSDTSKVYNKNNCKEWKHITASTGSSNIGWYKLADIAMADYSSGYKAGKIVGYFYLQSNWYSGSATEFAFECVVNFKDDVAYLYVEPYGNTETDTVRLVKTAERVYELQVGINTANKQYDIIYQVESSYGVTPYSGSLTALTVGTEPDGTDSTLVTKSEINYNFFGYIEHSGESWKKLVKTVYSSSVGWYKIAELIMPSDAGSTTTAKIVGYLYYGGEYRYNQPSHRCYFQCIVRYKSSPKLVFIDPYGYVGDTDVLAGNTRISVRLICTETNTYELQFGCNIANGRYSVAYQVISGSGVTTYQGTAVLGTTTGTVMPQSLLPTDNHMQSDWNVTDTTSDAYIKNKPTFSEASSISLTDNVLLQHADGTYGYIGVANLKKAMLGFETLTSNSSMDNYYDSEGLSHASLVLTFNSTGKFGLNIEEINTLLTEAGYTSLSTVTANGTDIGSSMTAKINSLLSTATNTYIVVYFNGSTITKVSGVL